MSSAVFHARMLRVLAERGRDWFSGLGASRLMPGSVFAVTDHYGAGISAKLLARYDVMAVVGHSTWKYDAGEVRAIEAFVRRGGTLVIAASAGTFEKHAERGAEEMAAWALAGRFGFGFETAAGLPINMYDVRGVRREDVEMTAEGGRCGLTMGDIFLGSTGTITVPRRARVLLRTAGGKPIMAAAEVGRGKVLVSGDAAMWNSANPWVLAHFLISVEPKTRVGGREENPKGKVPTLVPALMVKKVGKKVTMFFSPGTEGRAARLHELAEKVYGRLVELVPPAKPYAAVSIFVCPGAGGRQEWRTEDRMEFHLGVDCSDAAAVELLALWLGLRMVGDRVGWEVREVAVWPGGRYLAWRILREMGFAERARQMEEENEASPRIKGVEKVDLSRVYSEAPSVVEARRFWLDVAGEFGAGALTAFALTFPKNDAYKHIDVTLWTELDIVARGLARCYGPRVYDWLEGRGHTVRRMPPAKLDSKAFPRQLKKLLAEMVMDRRTPASIRFDAVGNLAALLKADKVSLDACAKRAGGKSAEALAAAFRLAQAKDLRGGAALGGWMAHQDESLAAVAALGCVYECPDKAAADRLDDLASRQDVRFQMAASYALGLAGDSRAARLEFKNLPGCTVEKVLDGQVKAFPTVGGYPVANVFSEPAFKPVEHGGAFSHFYVQWVHTSPRWRRRGVARIGMAGSLDCRWNTECAVTSLHTGTQNVAHALYRDFGLIDYYRGQEFKKDLAAGEAAALPPEGVRIRRGGFADFAAAVDFFRQSGLTRPVERPFANRWHPDATLMIAEQKGKIIGVAGGTAHRGKANLDWLAVGEPAAEKKKAKTAKTKKAQEKEESATPRELTGRALLAALHREFFKQKVKTIHVSFWQPRGDAGLYWLLHRAGYGSADNGSVELFRINNLAQYLDEIRGMLEKRLAGNAASKEWTGSIDIQSAGRGARLDIDHAKVAVSSLPRKTGAARAATLRIAGEFAAIERFVFGIRSCFEEYLQIEVAAEPLVNDAVKELLETLFPRVIAE